MSLEGEDLSPSAELLELSRLAAAPKLTRESLKNRFGERGSWEIRPGQIWRAVGKQTNLLTLIASVESQRMVLVVPVSLEPTGENENSAVTTRDTESFTSPLTIWRDLIRPIPTRLLDRPIDGIGNDIASWTLGRSPLPVGFRLGHGPALPSDLDVRSMLEDDIEELAQTQDWAPTKDIKDERSIFNLQPDILNQLAEELELPLPQVLELLDGYQDLTEDQAAIFRETLGTAPKMQPLPPELITEIDQPRHFSIVGEFQSRLGQSEESTRYSLAKEVFALAARQTGGGKILWKNRIEQWAAAQSFRGIES